MTYREIVNLVMDEVKIVTDDSIFTEDHVVFLADKYRMFLLKQRYSDIRKEIPESNYQTLCIQLVKTRIPDNECIGQTYLVSTDKIPYLSSIGKQSVTPTDFFMGDINFVSSERFKYAGSSKGLQREAYATIAPNNKLYLKSGDSNFYYLKSVKLTGIFEDSANITRLICDETNTCDLLDSRFPIEEALVPPLVEMIVKEITAYKLQPADTFNNAHDDTIGLHPEEQRAKQNYYRNKKKDE